MHSGREHNFGAVLARAISQGLLSGQQGILSNLENERQQAQQDRLFGLEQERIGIAKDRQAAQVEQFGTTQERLSGAAELTAEHRTAMLEATLFDKTKSNPVFEKEKNQLELDKLDAEISKLNAQTQGIQGKTAAGGGGLFGKGSGTVITKEFFRSRLQPEVVGGTDIFPQIEMVQPPITGGTIDTILNLLGQQGGELQQLDTSRIDLSNLDQAQLGAFSGLSQEEQAQILQRVAQEIDISQFNALNPQEKMEILMSFVEAE